MAQVLIKVGTTQNNLVDMPNPSKMATTSGLLLIIN